MLHRDEAGRLWRVVGNGGLVPVSADDPEAQSYVRAVEQHNAMVRAEQAREREENLRRIEAERNKARYRSEPPGWRLN